MTSKNFDLLFLQTIFTLNYRNYFGELSFVRGAQIAKIMKMIPVPQSVPFVVVLVGRRYSKGMGIGNDPLG